MLELSELFPAVPNLYDFLSVHADMVYDEERVSKYETAINNVVHPGDVVVDIGTGTGLLAFLSLQAGARRVHAIERSTAVKWAKQLAQHHNMLHRIVFHEGDSRNIRLPEAADVIVSELLGHMAFEESMVECIRDARARFLAPGGHMIPRRVILKAAPVSEREVYPTVIDCWTESVRGIFYPLLRKHAVNTCYVVDIAGTDLLALPQEVLYVDLQASAEPKPRGLCLFEIRRQAVLNGIVLWFDAILDEETTLSTSPWHYTHWKQCFAPIEKPFIVDAGDQFNLEVNMNFSRGDSRDFCFSFNLSRSCSHAKKA